MSPFEPLQGLEGPNADAKKYQENLIELIKSIQGWEKLTDKGKREKNPSGQIIRNWLFDCGSLATRQEEVH